MVNKILIGISIALNIVLITLVINIRVSSNRLICDLQKAFNAERRYTWNILRDELGIDPAQEAQDYKNPLLTKEIYFRDCNNR